ncbi:glycosyltransferase [Solibacillus sp. FSL W8-0372]|uniref:glycosyltransferase family 32 protein n=1 Tax=Solibacillus sp. FSL W8-0372 TaxID=2921713 RepID=UPI0030D50391
MIPKKIHYCWFGGNEYPQLMKDCIESWKKYLPEYELIEWNESNFDIKSNQFVKEAYEAKKYAFVSDYVRLYVLYNYGGIYLDTDVEVKKSLNNLLGLKAFTGRESDDSYVTGTLGAEKGHLWIKELLDYYTNKSFYDSNGHLTNTVIITQITKQIYKDIENSNPKRVYESQDLTIYPFEYFCAKDYKTGILKSTKNTYSIHHFNGSWLSKKTKIRTNFGRFYRRIFNWGDNDV